MWSLGDTSMISDRQFSLSVTTALAWLLWIKVVVDLTLAWVLHDDLLAYVGLACSAAAATVHIRSFMCVFSCRMRDAFEMGREVEREKQRELRSVT